MARAVIITLAVFVALVGVAIAVIPKERMYVAIPIPAPAAAATPAATPPATNTTSNTTTTNSTTAAPAGATLNIIPLGQLLGYLCVAFFGALTPNALNIVPIGAWIGYILQSIFGTGLTPTG